MTPFGTETETDVRDERKLIVMPLSADEGKRAIEENNLRRYRICFPAGWDVKSVSAVVGDMINGWGEQDKTISRITDAEDETPIDPETEVVIYTLRSYGDKVSVIQQEPTKRNDGFEEYKPSPSVFIVGSDPIHTAEHYRSVIGALNRSIERVFEV